MWWSQRGHKRHNMAHARYMLDKQGYMSARARMNTPMQPNTHTHTDGQTDKYVTLFAFPRKRLDITLHVLCPSRSH